MVSNVVQATNVIPLHRYLYLKCPACGKRQRFEQNRYSHIWFPIADREHKYCCDVMQHADSVEWNHKLDHLLEQAKRG